MIVFLYFMKTQFQFFFPGDFGHFLSFFDTHAPSFNQHVSTSVCRELLSSRTNEMTLFEIQAQIFQNHYK